MSNKYVGTGFIFGTNSTTNTSWGVSGSYYIQSRDFSPKATKYEVADGNGITQGVAYYNQMQVATFDVTIASNSTVPTIAIGDKHTLVDATFTQLGGTNWYVEEIQYKNTNKDALGFNVTYTQYSFS